MPPVYELFKRLSYNIYLEYYAAGCDNQKIKKNDEDIKEFSLFDPVQYLN
jgi:hypothetical protein